MTDEGRNLAEQWLAMSPIYDTAQHVAAAVGGVSRIQSYRDVVTGRVDYYAHFTDGSTALASRMADGSEHLAVLVADIVLYNTKSK